jgi:integrase
VTVPITSEIRELLWPLQGHHPEMVFTYVCERAEHGRVRGQRYPLTRNGLNSYWSRLRKDAGIIGLRFHDLRHDFGTKLLRSSGNLKLVQRAMNHRDIKTTLKYAHVLDSEVAAAMERVAESRKKSRTVLREVG